MRDLLLDYEQTRASLPPKVRQVILFTLNEWDFKDGPALGLLRAFLEQQAGHGSEDIANPIPAIQAFRYHFPLRMQYKIFDQNTRDMIDNAARLAGLLPLDWDEVRQKHEQKNIIHSQLNQPQSSIPMTNFYGDENFSSTEFSHSQNSIDFYTFAKQKREEDPSTALVYDESKLPSLFAYLDDYAESKKNKDIVTDQILEEQVHIQHLINDLTLQDIPGMEENDDLDLAMKNGYEPLQWLRWLFISALRRNIDTEPLWQRITQLMSITFARRIYNNANFQLDVRKLINAAPYRKVPSWATRWIGDEGDEEDEDELDGSNMLEKQKQIQKAALEKNKEKLKKDFFDANERRVWRLVNDLQKKDIPVEPIEPIAWFRWLLVEAIRQNHQTEMLINRIQQIYPDTHTDKLFHIFKNENFKHDLLSALEQYEHVPPQWIIDGLNADEIQKQDKESDDETCEPNDSEVKGVIGKSIEGPQLPATSTEQIKETDKEDEVLKGWKSYGHQIDPQIAEDPIEYNRRMMFGPKIDEVHNYRQKIRDERKRRTREKMFENIYGPSQSRPDKKLRYTNDPRYSGEGFTPKSITYSEAGKTTFYTENNQPKPMWKFEMYAKSMKNRFLQN